MCDTSAEELHDLLVTAVSTTRQQIGLAALDVVGEVREHRVEVLAPEGVIDRAQ